MTNVKDNNHNSNSSSDQTNDGFKWTVDFRRGKNGQILSNNANAELVLRNDSIFTGVYWFNDMTRTEEVRNSSGKLHPLDDNHLCDALVSIQKFWLSTIGFDAVRRAVIRECARHPYHPVKEYINSLKWDNKPRLETWLSVYLGTENTDYTQAISYMSLIAMIARVFQPGCKCDYVPVLEGPQGIGKSTAIKILFGEYFSDYLPDIQTKDASIHVSRYWGIEISEMNVLNRHDSAALKSFITRSEEQYRPPYATLEVTRPRQCVIWGSINHFEGYLKDETGGRRFWPVKCGRIDTDALQRDRDQLLAEAAHLYHQGWKWWPPRDLEADWIAPEQEARREVDEWQSLVLKNIRTILDPAKTSVAEIFKVVLGVDRLPNTAEGKRVASILRNIGARFYHTSKGNFWDVSGVEQ